MKNHFAALFFLALAGSPTIADEAADPFAVVVKKPIDRRADKPSEHFLSNDLLKAAGERRLSGSIRDGDLFIRITILRSFHGPLVFKWFPAHPEGTPKLQIKRLKKGRNEEGEETYEGVDLEREVEISPAQDKLLKELYWNSPAQELPQPYWTHEALDGSKWIYEVMTDEGWILIARRNPINPVLDGLNEDRARISKELQLTSFALMLWMISGIDEEAY